MIDEADLLLDASNSMSRQVLSALQMMPSKMQRQTILASATFPATEMTDTLAEVSAVARVPSSGRGDGQPVDRCAAVARTVPTVSLLRGGAQGVGGESATVRAKCHGSQDYAIQGKGKRSSSSVFSGALWRASGDH